MTKLQKQADATLTLIRLVRDNQVENGNTLGISNEKLDEIINTAHEGQRVLEAMATLDAVKS